MEIVDWDISIGNYVAPALGIQDTGSRRNINHASQTMTISNDYIS